MESVRILNLAISLSGIVLCCLGLLQFRINAKLDIRTERYFMLSYTCLFLFAVSNLAGQLLRGHPGAGVRAGLYLANFGEYLFSCLLIYILSLYLLTLVDRKQSALGRIMMALVLAHLALLIVSQFTGLYYVIDEANIYRRSPGYPISYIFSATILLIDIYLLIRHRDRLIKKERIALWSYFLIPGVAMVLQIFIYGFNFVVFATIIGAMVMYVFIVADQTERYYRQREENAKLKIEILLAQIQPHFLYNSLTVIKSICRRDPEQAEQAIDRFVKYLRYNMDSLSEDKPIPFTKELEHVQRYLELQQLRFHDELQVAYDLQCTAFSIPTLTIQPLVENAVTYGVRRSETGAGVVTIRTREYPDRYEISVIDTGPGFVRDKLPGDQSRSHTGLRNVRERLRHVCGGELKIQSETGIGTTVTIVLPKEGAPC